jgi:hypothetical protein
MDREYALFIDSLKPAVPLDSPEVRLADVCLVLADALKDHPEALAAVYRAFEENLKAPPEAKVNS